MSELSEKNRYNELELSEFKAIIDTNISKAQHELDLYLSQLKELNESSESRLKNMDDGSSATESTRISNMVQRQQKLLQHLDHALLRMKNGSYGVCSVTGKLIAPERLRLVPHATKTVEGKEQQQNFTPSQN